MIPVVIPVPEPELHHFSNIKDSSSGSTKNWIFYSKVMGPEPELNRNYMVFMILVPVPVPVKNGIITPLQQRVPHILKAHIHQE